MQEVQYSDKDLYFRTSGLAHIDKKAHKHPNRWCTR